ncbi:MarR family winged helix-turn-helix transcriptional regulator [Paractinoplanes abujensis]|uniref:DNA-binding MarR family transcriptional regulator n=1 Tax=Paractinoplanes abujensis TaxID=882441 RepID=A0A7W7G750_9ACTN|nr:MarR family transcriptional regulator [Actinoplanes abujensis]MBB4698110.1 DNA-binding MarR family transcriptional regulator [Actinoplanes abujensis]
MDRVSDAAAAVESTVDALVSVLESAGLGHATNVPPAQLRVLAIVADTRHTNMSRLAEALEVVPSSASRLCDRLEATGLLRRVPDPRDRREVRLLLTPAARRLLDDLRERRRQALEEVLGRMQDEERQDLVRSLRAFATAAAGDDKDEDGSLRTA